MHTTHEDSVSRAPSGVANETPGGPAPIQCAPWCSDGDGHSDEIFREDQRCYSPSSTSRQRQQMERSARTPDVT